MLEKLLENWLDSASERSYQPIFVQMLAMQNYRVLHSTRHCALEYGKDVIAINPDGIPCAFQLKGKPGGRISLGEFRDEIQPQLIQLISQPIIYPGIPTERKHLSFLVCNGDFDEEVQRAIDDLNRAYRYVSKIELISRGTLLAWAKLLGNSLWPSELKNARNLLELYLFDGREPLPVEKLKNILDEMLALGNDTEALTKPKMERAVSSVALLVGIATTNFSESENNYGIISAWCIFLISVIGAHEKHNLPLTQRTKQSLNLAESAIKDALIALWEDIKENKYLIEGDAMIEPEIYKWRYTLICGLLAVAWFFPCETPKDIALKDEIRNWLCRKHDHIQVWGEAAIPSYLALLYFLRRTDATKRPDIELCNLMDFVVNRNQPNSNVALADPYYDFEEIARHAYHLPISEKSSGLLDDSFSGGSFTAELLLHLVARACFKNRCQIIWPNFTRLMHKQFLPATPWRYCLFRADEGENIDYLYPFEYSWEQLRQDAAVKTCDYLPKLLRDKPHLLLLWTIIAPHRLTSAIGRILSAELPRK